MRGWMRGLALVAATLSAAALAQDAPPAATEPRDEAALADAFARLTVRAYGREIFDIGTGETTLPEGGEVVDTASGVRLSAPYISLREGERLEARDPTVMGAFGELTASALTLDMEHAVLTAEGPLRLVREGLALEAAHAVYDAARQLAGFTAPRSESNALEAARLLLDPRTGHALLVGPYRYQDGVFTLASDEEGALLALEFSVVDGVGGYDATTEIDPAFLEPFRPLLEAP